MKNFILLIVMIIIVAMFNKQNIFDQEKQCLNNTSVLCVK